jgi:putative transposase
MPIELACRLFLVPESSFYAQRNRPPSARSPRHAFPTDLIRLVHVDPHGIYGVTHGHAELTLRHALIIGHSTNEILLRRASIQGISDRPRFRRVPIIATISDLVERQIRRDNPDEPWVTDIAEHPPCEGKVYCAVVLDVFSRKFVD